MRDSSSIHSKTPNPEVNTSVPTDYPSAFQGPIQIVGRVEGDETTDTFACPSRSALRSIDMLTGAHKSQGHKVPRTVAATCGKILRNRYRSQFNNCDHFSNFALIFFSRDAFLTRQQ